MNIFQDNLKERLQDFACALLFCFLFGFALPSMSTAVGLVGDVPVYVDDVGCE